MSTTIPFFITLGVAIVLSIAVHYGLVAIGRIVRRTPTKLDDVIFTAVDRLLVFLILTVGIEAAVGVLTNIQEPLALYLDDGFFLLRMVIVYLLLHRTITSTTDWYAETITHKTATELDDKFLTLFRNLAVIILSVVCIAIVLNEFAIDITAMVTTLGITSLAVALAAQDTLSNMIAGFFLMLDQPFHKGDRIGIEEISSWGDVQDIGLRTTRILTSDHRMVSIPNAKLAQGLIVNYSAPDTRYRIETTVGVAYGTDLEFARQTMVNALSDQDWVLHDMPIEALLLNLGESSLDFRVRCWINSVIDTRPILDKMNTELYIAIHDAGIDIPFPQRVVRMLPAESAD